MAEKQVDAPAAPPPKQTLARSVEKPPDNLFAGPGGGNTFTLWMATVADTFTPWGTDYVLRDKELRDFFHTETFLSGAVYTSAITNAQLQWKLEGPEQTSEAVLELLNSANMGKGWAHFAKQLSLDLYTQDNGAFAEVIRQGNNPEAPVIGIKTLDAGRCQRTGDLNTPVIYTDRVGNRIKMPWYSVITFEEFPSSIETMYGLQYCAVTRALRAAQILRDFAIYKGEKAGGRFADAIHIVGGVSSQDLEDVRKRAEEEGDNAGQARYLGALVIGSLDPESTPSVATLDFKSLPDAFNLDDEMRWYISSLALAFGRDYQDFAPLPSGNLGSGQQSETLHKKARQKAAASFMRMIEQAFNFQGIMPQTVTFEFELPDLEEDRETAEIAKTWSETFEKFVDAKVIPPNVARMILEDEGILKPEHAEGITDSDFPEPEFPVMGGGQEDRSNGRPTRQLEDPTKEVEEKMAGLMLKSLEKNVVAKPILQMVVDESEKGVRIESKLDELIEVVERLDAETLQTLIEDSLIEVSGEIAVAAELSIAMMDQNLEERGEQLDQNLEERGQQLEEQFERLRVAFVEENEDRKQAIKDAMRGLQKALTTMSDEQKELKSIGELTAESNAKVKKIAEDLIVVDSEVTKRDKNGKARMVRKTMASGAQIDYKIIRDKEGNIRSLRAIE